MRLEDAVDAIKGVGKKQTDLLKKIGVYSVSDMLLHFPRDYVSYPEPVREGLFEVDTLCAIKATVISKPFVRKGRIPITSCNVTDGFTEFTITWFHMPYLASAIDRGGEYVFYGRVETKSGRFVMDQPKLYTLEHYEALRQTMQPVYALTAGLKNYMLEKAIRQVLDEGIFPPEVLPEEIIVRYDFPSQEEAIRTIHFPEMTEKLKKAIRKFSYENFFLFLLGVRFQKFHFETLPNEAPVFDVSVLELVKEHLPYQLTKGQEDTLSQIIRDVTGPSLMQRLVQGDVGSGKTIVAFITMLIFAENGYSSALMAPTEVLARQHAQTLEELVGEIGLPYDVVLLTGSLKTKEKREAYERLMSGKPVLAVGTHALIQEKVAFANLGLVITDEQHRFGVRQRDTLSEKGIQPHVLVMSATPIPRTLSLILYGDLDVSIMATLPAERLPIKNAVITEQDRMNAYKLIYQQIQKGHQAYIICPLVSQNEELDLKDTESFTKELQKLFPEDVTIESLNGQMKSEDKDAVMARFAANEIQILVSTTVIEVGINVPNATVILVENAERFGLAQLHQLRGRVGRSEYQSYCLFMNGSKGDHAAERLEILRKSNDGFMIAEEDMKLRGPGDYFGVRQSGDLCFKVGDIYRDRDLLRAASADVDEILSKDPDLSSHEQLREAVISFMREREHNAGL